ncbi:MAG: hypothetical protein WCW16_00860 [Candidatus Magasanikbacteria bacterium]|jgi:hypothetical protein
MAQINPTGEKKRQKGWKNSGGKVKNKKKGKGQKVHVHVNKYANCSRAPANIAKVIRCTGCGAVLVHDEDKNAGKCAACRKPVYSPRYFLGG